MVGELEGALCAHICDSKPNENVSTLAAPRSVARDIFNAETVTKNAPEFCRHVSSGPGAFLNLPHRKTALEALEKRGFRVRIRQDQNGSKE